MVLRLFWSFLTNTMTIGAAYLFASSFLKKKEGWSINKTVGLFILVGAISSLFTYFLLNYYHAPAMLRIVLLSLRTGIYFWLVLFPYEGQFFKKIYLVLFLIMIAGIAELIGILFYLRQNESNTFQNMGISDMNCTYLISCVVMYTFILLFNYFRKKRQVDVKKPIGLYLLEMMIPASSSLTVAIAYLFLDTKGLIVIFFFALIINIIGYLLFDRLEKYYEMNQIYALKEQQNRQREEYYQQVERSQNEIRTMKHDLKNQLIAISGLFSDSKLKKDNPLQPLIQQLSNNMAYDFTAHAEVNAILASKYRQAEYEGIHCQWEVHLPASLQIEAIDLAVLLGNILDNAMDACRYCKTSPYIQLQIVYYDALLIIECENSTDGESSQLSTRKMEKKNHGLGMGSIRSVVEKYSGEMQYSFFKDRFQIEMTLFEGAISDS